MAIIQRVVKPITRKGKRVLLAREPQVNEEPKKTLIFQGRKCSSHVKVVLQDILNLKKPDVVRLNRKNDITIFENSTPVELFCKKHDCSLFVMGSSNKKRPNNIVFGRMFDNSLLDMFEFGIDMHKGLKEFSDSLTLGIKPCLVFCGPLWDQSIEMQNLHSLLIDLFHREKAKAVRLQGLEHVISFTAIPDGKILFRSYKVLLKKSNTRIPRIELEEIGPQLDLSMRRHKLASEDLMKQATRKPKVLKITVKKNISKDGLGTKLGRIHVGKQDINNLQTRKMKGLKKAPADKQSKQPQKRKAPLDDTDIAKKTKL